jgi:hypothetical protein
MNEDERVAQRSFSFSVVRCDRRADPQRFDLTARTHILETRQMKLRPVSLALVSALAVGALGVPTFASARTDAPSARTDAPPPPPQPDYEACRQAHNNRVAGGLLGAVAGAVLGSNVAGHGAKSEGGVIGGVAGAVVGSKLANGSAAAMACNGYAPPPPPPPPAAYYGPRPHYGYGYAPRRYDNGYGYAPPPPPRVVVVHEHDRDDRDYDRDDEDYGYRRAGDGSSADGCRLAESPIYMPDGRTEKRFVRVCADENGRYHVVD